MTAIVDLILQGVTIVAVVIVGLHLRQQLRSLQTTVEAQEKTIAAQVKYREEFEALTRTMKQVMETLDPDGMLKAMQAYKAIVEANSAEARRRERGSPPIAPQAKVDFDVFTYNRPKP